MIFQIQKLVVFSFCLLIPFQIVFGAVDRNKVKNGINSFSEEKWDEALNQFQDALLDDPSNPLVHFNVGDGYYKNQKFEEALDSFEKTIWTSDVSLQQKAFYNLGNSYYKLDKYQEAIDAYKKALELDPNDEDAKHNLELVRAKLKEMAEKKPAQNQQQQQSQQEQGEQQEGSQQEQSEQQKDQNQKKEGRDQQQEQQNQQGEEKPQSSPDEDNKKELTKEQAEQILRALRSKEDANKKLRPMPRTSGKAHVEKDW
jgi:Ca-activated chloride channel family protein